VEKADPGARSGVILFRFM